RGPVPTRCGGDLDRGTIWVLQPGGRPRLEPARFAAEPLRSRDGGHNDVRARQKRLPGGIEIVLMVVVAEQDAVHRPQLRRGKRRAGELGGARAPAEAVLAAGWIE